MSSQNIFVTQGYSYYFSHTKELQGIAVNQNSVSTVLSQKQNFTVTNQKIVKDYFSSIHYLTPNLVINLYLTNSIIQIWLIMQSFCHPLWSEKMESFRFEDIFEDDISILSFQAFALNIDTLESNIVPFSPQKLVCLFL